MKDISLVAVTVHVDESMSKDKMAKLEDALRAREGVVSVHSSEKTPHLVVVTYDPAHATGRKVLETVMGERLHAELIGL